MLNSCLSWFLSCFAAGFGRFLCSASRFGGLQTLRAQQAPGSNRNQFSHPHQVVSCGCKAEDPSPLVQAAMFQLTQQSDIFYPAEAFLNALPFLLADRVAAVARG